MAFMKFYFRDEEAEFIRSKPKGWVRRIVLQEMMPRGNMPDTEVTATVRVAPTGADILGRRQRQ
jgi:hypothetical protein